MMSRKTLIRIGIVVVITCVMCFSDWSFAAEVSYGSGDKSVFLSFARVLNFIVSILSWIWILFAKLAGEFLTNKRVYGEVLKLDSLLWQYRNLMKNMANFGLGFYFVYVIFKGLISKGKESITDNIKNVLLWILIAGVGIQASWFVTAAVIDLSTITLSAAGSFPAQIISQNETLQVGVERAMIKKFFTDGGNEATEGVALDLFPQDSKASEFLVEKINPIKSKEPLTKEKFFDILTPNDKDVSGPLFYMGYAILKTNNINSLKTHSDPSIKESILNLIIQGGANIVYSIEMAVLCILALMRILYLWMFIVLSPIVFLIWCIEQSGQKISGGNGKESFFSSLTKQLNFKSFFVNVFKPTIIVLGIGLAMIFATLMNDVINGAGKGANKPIDIGGIVITTTKDSNENVAGTDETYTTAINSDFFNYTFSHVGKGILDFVLSIITVILVYMIIQVAVKMGGGKDFVSEKIGKIQDSIGKAATSIPIVPVAGYDKNGVPTTRYMNAGQVFGGLDKSNSILGGTFAKYDSVINDRYSEQNQIIKSWFGNNTGFLSGSQMSDIRNAGSGGQGLDILKAKMAVIKRIPENERKNGLGMTLNPTTASNDGFWIKQFGGWLTSMNGGNVTGTQNDSAWNNLIQAWKSSKTTDIEKKIKEVFEGNSERIKAYADFFELGNITTWEELKNADISKLTTTQTS